MNEVKNVNSEEYRVKLRALVNNFYDMQKLRIQMGNRLVASLGGLAEESHKREKRDKGFIESGKVDNPENIPDENKIDLRKINKILDEYHRVTDFFSQKAKNKVVNPTTTSINKAIGQLDEAEHMEFIKSYCDYRMAQNYDDMLRTESNALKPIEDMVKQHPMWTNFFAGVQGCGVTMAAICLAYFNPDTARHASSFWKYCGLDVVTDKDGNPAGHDKRYTVEVEYVTANGEIKTKKSLGYNPFLKSKVVEVLGGSIIKQCVRKDEDGNKVYKGYAKAYADYMNRLDNHAEKKEYTKYHKHRMAQRYMVKQFVRDMWYVWRDLCGYQLEDPYEVAFLGRKHHGYNEAVDKRLDDKLSHVPAKLRAEAAKL